MRVEAVSLRTRRRAHTTNDTWSSSARAATDCTWPTSSRTRIRRDRAQAVRRHPCCAVVAGHGSPRAGHDAGPDDGDRADPLDTLARDRPLGFAGADLLELSDTPLSRALLALPATVAIVRGAWSRSHADGVAVWPAGALAWCWRAVAGSAKACGRVELPSLVRAAARGAPGDARARCPRGPSG